MLRSIRIALVCGCLAIACRREPSAERSPPVIPSASTSVATTPSASPPPASSAYGESSEGARNLDAAREALSAEARPAFETLRNATVYESEKVGEAGSLSKNAEAVRAVIREPKAPLAFQALFDHATPTARIYALAAFWYLRPADFQSLVAKLRQELGTQKVETLHGCKGGTDSVAEILDPVPGAVQAKPGSSTYDLLCKHRDSFTADFAGGFDPISIVEGTTLDEKRCAKKPPLADYLKPR